MLEALPTFFLIAAAAVIGCSQHSGTPKAEPNKDANNNADAGHAHGTGPNGGALDLSKYHVEFVVDHPAKECMVLLATGDTKDARPLPVAAKELTRSVEPTKVKEGVADEKIVPPTLTTLEPVDGRNGKASKFVGTELGIGNVTGFEGTVIGNIDGKPSQETFKE